MARLAAIPTLVVSGPRGSGKTALIARLLAERRPGETWAVLLNERGAGRIESGAGIAVAEVGGGCMCCTAQVGLRVALTRLLREARPARLFVELSAASHVPATLATFGSPWLAPALALGPVVEIVEDPADHRPAPGVRRIARPALDGVTLATLYGTSVNEPR